MVCGHDGNNVLASIEILGARVSSQGGLSWLSKSWLVYEPEHLAGRFYPLVAPLISGRLLLFGGRQGPTTVLYDG